ncbi:MAG: Dynein regulatory complex subunit 3 [Paramarteilia canceri]
MENESKLAVKIFYDEMRDKIEAMNSFKRSKCNEFLTIQQENDAEIQQENNICQQIFEIIDSTHDDLIKLECKLHELVTDLIEKCLQDLDNIGKRQFEELSDLKKLSDAENTYFDNQKKAWTSTVDTFLDFDNNKTIAKDLTETQKNVLVEKETMINEMAISHDARLALIDSIPQNFPEQSWRCNLKTSLLDRELKRHRASLSKICIVCEWSREKLMNSFGTDEDDLSEEMDDLDLENEGKPE